MVARNAFRCFSSSPLDAQHAGTAIAAARAGGVGLLDAEFCHDFAAAARNLNTLIAAVGRNQDIGLRAHVSQLAQIVPLLASIECAYWLVLAGMDEDGRGLKQWLQALPKNESRKILLELTGAVPAKAAKWAIDGYVIRGHEAGGRVGEDSVFILAQKILPGAQRPVYVQGGIGIHTAAACRAAGAAGVVLDDQLLLMPESSLAKSWQQQLEKLTGQEAALVGERLENPCRVFARPGFAALSELQTLAERIELENAADAANEWREQASRLIGWNEPLSQVLPIGQAAGLAAGLRDRYKTTGRLIQAIMRESLALVEAAAAQKPMQPGSPLAVSHGTRYPIVQGPMTRVSDTAAFAESVAAGGGLPFLALALMRKEQVSELLYATRDLLGNRSWGVGMLGFVSHALREEQMQVIREVKPPFALIAGGRPDQAAKFEAEGIHTYLHVPSPNLLRMFLEQGARRFIFEGRECGGHIGPLCSFVLWEQMIGTLLSDVPQGKEQEVHVLFAGGIHDARSAAMVGVLSAGLAKRGVRVGVLMGTAYLFTHEAVEGGAITKGFQEQSIECRTTANLETGPGHSTRCAVTPFVREFFATRRDLMKAGKAAEEVRDALEDLNLGRLRIAAKGVTRDESGSIVSIDEATQTKDGMYMIGQVATLRSEVCTVEDLHRDVSQGATDLIAAAVPAEPKAEAAKAASDIAVIGIGTLLPKADNPGTYWRNILDRVNAISEIPQSRWDWRLYFDEDRKARDKIYSKWGGFIDDVPFDPLRFGIPPTSLRSIDPVQLLALETVRRALEDAGYADGDFDREHTSVILGASGGLGDVGQQYGVRSELPRFAELVSEEMWDRLPEWTEESFSGSLLNVVAGRIANRMNLGGMNMAVDAACASSLAAVYTAVNELESGRANVAIAGGVDTVQGPYAYMCFSKTQALSPRGRARTFDKGADGIVISEGLAFVVLKRLADAERDGDRIYGVIKATGCSSDGKALGLTAPLPAGQIRALRRAYDKAGYSPNTIGLVEAHGTGTAVGDSAEAQTVVTFLREHEAPARSCAIGSVKTLIGHTKASAGIAGMIKMLMSLHHKALPAHVGVDQPIDSIADGQSPVYLLKDPRPWLRHPAHPRRAGVSAFGFGGTNFHVALEEYSGEFRSGARPSGAADWPAELFIFSAADRTGLEKDIQALHDVMAAGAQPRLRDLAYSYARKAEAATARSCIAAAVVTSREDLIASLAALTAHLRSAANLPVNVLLNLNVAEQAPKVAFLFPGQGSQYPDMGREALLYLDDMRAAMELADAQLGERLPKLLSQYIYPPASFNAADEDKHRAELMNTAIAQPAIGTMGLGFMRLAARLGIHADMVAGHSYGEYSALCAGGILSEKDFLALSATRGRVMSEAAGSGGGMGAVQASREVVVARLASVRDVVIANHNAPSQSVVSGPKDQVQKLVEAVVASGGTAQMLPVAAAFHSSLVQSAQTPLTAAIMASAVESPRIPVYGNKDGKPYPVAPEAIRSQLSSHMLSTVEFVKQIETMYLDGARVFVELGPKNVLSRLASQVLEGREFNAVSFDRADLGMVGVLSCLAKLAVCGVRFQYAALFENRDAKEIDLSRLATIRPAAIPASAWLINGGGNRPQSEQPGRTGKLPPLTLETLSAKRNALIEAVTPAPVQIQAAPSAVVPAMRAAEPSPEQNSQLGTPLSEGAYTAYQDTMRQFLVLQEQVMSQYLARQNGGAPLPVAPTAAAPVHHTIAAPVPVTAKTPATPVSAPVPVQVATPAVAPAAAPQRATITELLIQIVSDRTGYPGDMLGLDQDMEANLGIDSIKRVEILGALQKQLPAELAARIQSQMESFTRVKTLNGVIDQLMEGMAVTAVPAPTPVAAVTEAPAPAVPQRATLTQLLVQIVADRTGYPGDMLGLDQDMEANLGIDSIKRVEILGALQKQLPAELGARIQSQMESFTRVKTLNGVIDQLMEGMAVTAVPAPAPIAVAASAPAVPQRATLTQLLVQIVADRTGYPADMLGLDQDMEANLGIDSIKRVEILGALQKQLPAELGARIQSQMENFTRVKTLNGVIDQLMEGMAVTAVPAPAPIAVAASAPAVPQRATLTQLLVQIVADRTGYPADMLGLDQDMEANLGIDSIKRVEILGALQKQLPAELAARIQSQMENFTRVKTLNGVIDQLLQSADVAVAAPVAKAAVAATAVAVTEETAPVFTIRPRAESLPEGKEHWPQGLVLITPDHMKVAPFVAQALKAKGAKVELLEPGALASSQAVAAAVKKAREAHGPVQGILHLAPLAVAAKDMDLAAWRNATSEQVKGLFWLLRECAADIQAAARQGNAALLSASLLGGTFARLEAATGLAAAGGACGLLKCLAVEWSGVRAKAIDFDATLGAEEYSRHILAEFIREGRTEVGYPKGMRTVFDTVAASKIAGTPNLTPAKDWVALVTGGARGITAEIAEELAAFDMTLILAGRSPLPQAETAQTASIEDTAALRAVFIERLKAQGLAPTPVLIDKQLRELMGAREIRRNIARLQSAGARVHYRAVDVRNEAEFSGLLEEIYREHGRLDAVIHGAGVIEDKLVVDKTDESFDRVFDTKVDSSFILSRHLRPESLKLLVFFTSVAGRYGNRGQSDYAAANEAVNRMAWELSRQWPQTHVAAINWGPWDSQGMASEGVKRQFREQGIIPIALSAGRRAFVEEMIQRQRAAGVEVVVGKGPWASDAAQTSALAPAPVVSSMTQATPVNEVILLRIPPKFETGANVMEHTFSIESDPYLQDHRLDGNPVLPATMALEWMAQFVQQAWPEWVVTGVQDLRVFKGVVVKKPGTSVLFKARASSHADAESLAVTAEIIDPSNKLPYYRASVILMPALPEAPAASYAALDSGVPIEAANAYRDYLFHGPRFHLVTKIDRLSEQGIDALVKPSMPAAWLAQGMPTGQWMFDPGLADTAPQLAIVWCRVNHDTTVLPARFGSVRRYRGASMNGDPLRVAMRVKSLLGGEHLVYDAIFIDAAGKVRLEMLDLEGTCSRALNRLAEAN